MIWEICVTVGPLRPNPSLSTKTSHAVGDFLTAEIKFTSSTHAHYKNLPSLLLRMFMKNKLRCRKTLGSSYSSTSSCGSSLSSFFRLKGRRIAVPNCWSAYSMSLSSKSKAPKSGSRLSLAIVGISLFTTNNANFKVNKGIPVVFREPTIRGSTISEWKWGAKRWGVRQLRSSQRMILSLMEWIMN